MNKVILIGRLTKDADLRFAQTGKAVARFTMAVNRPMKKDEADFIGCIAFDKKAEVLAQYTQKGSQISIEGHIRTGSYDKDGTKVYTTEIIVDNLEFLSGNKTEKLDKVSDPSPFDNNEYGDIPF